MLVVLAFLGTVALSITVIVWAFSIIGRSFDPDLHRSFFFLIWASLFTAFAMVFALQAGPYWLTLGIYSGEAYSNPLVLSIPSTTDFWYAYGLGHSHAREDLAAFAPRTAVAMDIAAAICAAIAIWFLYKSYKEAARGVAPNTRGVLNWLWIFAREAIVIFLALSVMAFLFSYITGTAMFLYENAALVFGILVVLVIIGAAGAGGRNIYDENGKKIGRLD